MNLGHALQGDRSETTREGGDEHSDTMIMMMRARAAKLQLYLSGSAPSPTYIHDTRGEGLSRECFSTRVTITFAVGTKGLSW